MHIMYHVYTGYNHQEQTLNEKLNLRYCMTLNGIKVKVTSEGHFSVEVIKVYMFTKFHICTDYHHRVTENKFKHKGLPKC